MVLVSPIMAVMHTFACIIYIYYITIVRAHNVVNSFNINKQSIPEINVTEYRKGQ